MNKKIWIAGLLGMTIWGLPFALPAEAAETAAAQPAAENAEKKAAVYPYVSQEYGFSILCPKRPNVIPASALYDGAKGEVLIFENEEYNIKLAWVVLVDAFKDKDVPDFNKLSEKEINAYLEKMRKNYADVDIVDIGEKNKAFFGVTAKEIEVDTTGDGKPDTVMTADNQEMKAFFRTPKGGCYSVVLIDNPVLSPEAMRDCRRAIMTFHEVDAKAVPQK